jgi:hypothetical protein
MHVHKDALVISGQRGVLHSLDVSSLFSLLNVSDVLNINSEDYKTYILVDGAGPLVLETR